MFDLFDILKSEEGATGPVAGPSGHPRAGHKYVKREWSGGKWVYTYADDMHSRHGAATPAEHGEDYKHTVDVKQHTGNPEADYKHSVDQDLQPGKVHQVAGPKGEKLNLTKLKDNQYRLSTEDGKKVKDFTSRGAYELWHIGTSNTHQMADHEGTPVFDIRPNVGKVSEDGGFNPSSSKTKRDKGSDKSYARNAWVVSYNKDYPQEKRVGKADKWFKTSREDAENHAKGMIRDQEIASGNKPSTQQEPVDEEEKKAPIFAPPGSVADKIQSGQLPYVVDKETGKRHLNLSQPEKDRLIAQTAKEYYPAIYNIARQNAGNEFFARDSSSGLYGSGGKRRGQDAWMERFIGSELPDPSKPVDFIFPSPESPTYQAISDALDTYDPQRGVGFTGYLTGNKLKYGMQRAKEKFIQEIQGSQSMSVGTDEGVKDRTDFTSATPEEGQSNKFLQTASDALENQDVDDWHDSVKDLLDTWETKAPEYEPEKLTQAREVLENFNKLHPVEQAKVAPRISDALTDLVDWHRILGKSLERDAVILLLQEELFSKAVDLLTQNKNVDPEHTYAYMDGDSIFPKYYYTDQRGNYLRYTNAPVGHVDYLDYMGEPTQAETALSPVTNPDYFSPDGIKLTRAPDCEYTSVQWNPNYNQYDPQNLWVGKWISSENGTDLYTYADSDMRSNPQYNVHYQVSLVDAGLVNLRKYIKDLFYSDKIKDQITAIALYLMDQGHMRLQEVCGLTSDDVRVQGNLVHVSNRQIIADPVFANALSTLRRAQGPDQFLFVVPKQKADKTLVDNEPGRLLGPRYFSSVLDSLGFSLLALQMHRVNCTFFNEVQRIVKDFGASFEEATQFGLLAAAIDWGHDFTKDNQNVIGLLQLFQATLIDPVLINYLKQMSVPGPIQREVPPAFINIPYVNTGLVSLNEDETSFSSWLHTSAYHQVGN